MASLVPQPSKIAKEPCGHTEHPLQPHEKSKSHFPEVAPQLAGCVIPVSGGLLAHYKRCQNRHLARGLRDKTSRPLPPRFVPI